MQIVVPLGSKIHKEDNNNAIEFSIPKTKFWIRGEQQPSKKWDTFLTHQSGIKRIIKKDVPTREFAMFVNRILKTPFPYSGKKAENPKIITRFIKKLIN